MGPREPQWQRRAASLEGIVQGVGFRPFVYRTAAGLGLSGFVRNQAGGVYLEVEGWDQALNLFAAALRQDLPAHSRLEAVEWFPLPVEGGDGFEIQDSIAVPGAQIAISPDLATCSACLAELFDPCNRRYRYPFLNCTNCGPRLSIVQGAPYDRARTTMAGFDMCPACRREYDDPVDRRFHAQPTACPDCGPQLQLLTGNGEPLQTTVPVEEFARALRSGKIGALKGLGGYHLVCDARAVAEPVVAELRRRKHRDAKPFAVMVQDVEQARTLCAVNEAEKALLGSASSPIVLLRRRDSQYVASSAMVADSVAPGNPWLGVLLPYTPLHHLLMHAMQGIPLVMTSGNASDEPMSSDDTDAVERLAGIADMFLTHNRPIHVRSDDSVTRVVANNELPIRRARGAAPASLTLPIALRCPTLAVGAQLKSTFALGCQQRAILSHHVGDLDHFAAYQAFEREIQLYEALFEIHPELIVHDLHPDYASTHYAVKRSNDEGVPSFAVQHHHAHIASAMAEHQLAAPVIGVAFDGTGFGTDGAIWGGEFLIADSRGFHRAAHLRYVGLPGGDAAIREPWRSAVAHLLDADCDISLLRTIPAESLRTVQQMLVRGFNAPQTSSMGRLFDAVAAMIGVRTHVSYEGQAAIELEWLATTAAPTNEHYPYAVTADTFPGNQQTTLIIDTRMLIQAIAEDMRSRRPNSQIARQFHSTIAAMVLDVCHRLRLSTGLKQVVLSGGVFLNVLLVEEATQRLEASGFEVFRHHKVPPNDGGISLGQLAVAATPLTERPAALGQS